MHWPSSANTVLTLVFLSDILSNNTQLKNYKNTNNEKVILPGYSNWFFIGGV